MKNDIEKRIKELKITEEDLYFLSHIEGIKDTAGIFKEKYNKYMYGILKKNNVNSVDFLMISRYVKTKKFHLIPELIEKYGPYQLDNSKTSFDFKGMKAFAIFLGIIPIFFLIKVSINFIFPNPTWCDCDKAVSEAIEYSLFQGKEGSNAKYDKSTVTLCAEKAIILTDLKISPKNMDINYLAQVAFEVCKHGYYEGKYSDDRGKKYYSKED
jgi:hypothetical protein